MKRNGFLMVLMCALLVWGCSDSGNSSGSSEEAPSEASNVAEAVEQSESIGDESNPGDSSPDNNSVAEENDVTEEPGDTVEEDASDESDAVDSIETPDEDVTEEEDGEGGESPSPEDTTDEDVSTPDTTVEESTNGYPSEELNVMIVGPGSEDYVQSLGYIVTVNGILFGEAEEIQWTHMGKGESGTGDPGVFWQTGPIELDEGDNRIRIVAVAEDGTTATDEVTIVYNPSFLFGGTPKARPSTTLTGANTKHVVTLPITYTNIVPDTVALWETDAEGNTITKIGDMKDNGNLNSQCDEVQGDGVFSRCLTINESEASTKYYRAVVEVNNVLSTYEAWSPELSIEIADAFGSEVCTNYVTLLQNVSASHATAIEGGSTWEEAQDAAVAELLDSELVLEAGPSSGFSVWVRFANGILGGIPLGPENYRAAGALETSAEAITTVVDLGSKNATILSPAADSFGDFDESAWIANTLGDLGCPYFALKMLKNQYADLYQFRRVFDNGVLSISAHGDTLFGGLDSDAVTKAAWEHSGEQEVIWTGEALDCSNFLDDFPSCSGDGQPCQGGKGECVVGSNSYCVDHKSADLANGRLILGPTHYGIVPSYFKHHSNGKRLPQSLVYLGSCRSMFNGSLASVLFGLGAQTILGFSDYVTNQWAHDTAVSFFSELALNAGVTGEAFDAIDTSELENPESAETRIFGAKNLSISNSDIVNPSFETKDTTGWSKDGDGRVITSLGSTIPVDGKYMGLLSTGLGFTQEVGQLQQTFCLQSDVTQASFYWKFYSEEFLEYCGSTFQDAFTATLVNDTGQVTIVDVAVDDVCPATECVGCGAAAAEYGITLVPSDVSFDQGGVYHSQWVKGSANVTALAGEANGPVTFTYFASDVGDSIYDTVILVDKLVFE